MKSPITLSEIDRKILESSCPERQGIIFKGDVGAARNSTDDLATAEEEA